MPASWIAALAVCLAVALGGTPFDFAQDQPQLREFKMDGVHPNDPVQIVGFRVGDQIVKPGSEFQGDDEIWLKNSTIIVKNISKNLFKNCRRDLGRNMRG
jgi:hypothetical protein